MHFALPAAPALRIASPHYTGSTSFLHQSRYIRVLPAFRLLSLFAGSRCPWFPIEGQDATLGNKRSWESPRTFPQGHDVGSSRKHTLLAAAVTATVVFLSYGESPAGRVRGSSVDGIMHRTYPLNKK